MSEYRRDLDLDSAVAQVSFTAGGVSYTREVFCSAPGSSNSSKVSASKPGKLNLDVTLDSLFQSAARPIGSDGLRLHGKAPAHVEPNYVDVSRTPVMYDDADGKGMRFECRVQVRHKGGKIDGGGKRPTYIGRYSKSQSCLSAATGYRGFDLMPDLSADEIGTLNADRLRATAKKIGSGTA